MIESQEEGKRTSSGVGSLTSKKSQKTAGADSPSSQNGCNANGFEKALLVVRSVLHHQLG